MQRKPLIMEKVILGLSGGVDSAAAALLLKQQGYKVIGMWLDLGMPGKEQVMQAAAQLDIELVIYDAAALHHELVRMPFARAYMCAKTPNPCIVCNRFVKFHALRMKAAELGAKYIATGHYAGVDFHNGRYRILEAPCSKDQSYMLCGLDQQTLSTLILPLYGYEKKDIRSLIQCAGINAGTQKDSMDICFIPDGDYGAYLEGSGFSLPPGDFTDKNGNVLGRHNGLHRYTVGQRRGLGVSAGQRMYVSRLCPDTNSIVLVEEPDIFIHEIILSQFNWVSSPELTEPFRTELKLRHSKQRYPAELSPLDGGRWRAVFHTAVKRPAPGQAAVGYDRDALLFGSVIEDCLVV